MLLQKDFKCTERTRRLVTGTVFYAYEITHVSDGHQAILTYWLPPDILFGECSIEFRQSCALRHFYFSYINTLGAGGSGA